MRLSKVKLAGFKSFVDPTTIYLTSNLTAVVGPNGCGKSNIIDAVRWVMGESSAKHLRGDSMADVIFNGSSARQPVGAASIELVFDNSDGAIGGQYAGFSEISIKRQVSRDGVSVYSLNGTRCRRKDITGIFLGTGLGPRSYAIIEQGMITRLIDAKPDELRVYLEEAAGISKYKERRRETENRIRHTRDNLSRLEDLREEVDKHLSHLQRQARAAERYKAYKEDERRTEAELMALRLRGLESQGDERRRLERERENAVEQAVASLRRVEAEIEQSRARQEERTEAFNEVQGRYYKLGSEVARIEQAIQHGRELRRRQQKELEETEHTLADLREHLERDRSQRDELRAVIRELEPAVARSREAEAESRAALEAAEEAMQAWQADWDAFTQKSGETEQSSRVEKNTLEHLEGQLDELIRRAERLEEERGVQDPRRLEEELAELQRREEGLTQRLIQLQNATDEAQARISELRDEDENLTRRLDEDRSELQDLRGRLSSLEALQQAALGRSDSGATRWLERQGLADRPRLAQTLAVSEGWEQAVETVLGEHLEAVCVDGLDPVADLLESMEEGALSFLDTGAATEAPSAGASSHGETLAAKVEGAGALSASLSRVRCAAHLTEALAMRRRLGDEESVITPDGIWIGRHWLRVVREDPDHGGVLAREGEIRELQSRRDSLESSIQQMEERHEDTRLKLAEMEADREQQQADLNRLNREHAGLKGQLDAGRSRMEQVQERLSRIDAERADIESDIETLNGRIREARARLEGALGEMHELEARREKLLERREAARGTLDAARRKASDDRDRLHESLVRLESRRSSLESVEQGLERMESQYQRLQSRQQELDEQLSDDADPERDQKRELEDALSRRVEVESELAGARKALEESQAQVRELDQSRVEAEQAVQEVRENLSQAKIAGEEVRVRLETARERLAETGFEKDTLLAELPEEADTDGWQEKLERIGARIARLGNVNLAAIDEYEQQSERKEYLDAQYADLMEALETLENAIRRIDRETRTRFKETFDKVNAGLKSRFPRLFGGGHAYLELTGEDLLDAGVAIMARPPGKRNSTIHLLSGGEKALTAVALVFAIFDLNPAPFCMLDEVDAPLDDANVGRFSDLVKEMSESVQVTLITHNKVTMEVAHQLIGVTMSEPGVSRLVAVDIDEAVQMAAV